MKKLTAALLPVSLLLVLIAGLFAFPATAASQVSLTASEVKSDKFTATITFPAVNWQGFEMTLSYPSSVLTTTDDNVDYSCSVTGMNFLPNVSAGSCKFAGTGNPKKDMSSGGMKITVEFTVKDKTASSATLTLKIKSFVDGSNAPLVTYTSGEVYKTLAVTLKADTDTSSHSSSTTTHTDTDSGHSSSTKPVTDTDPKPSTSTKPKTDPEKPSTSTKPRSDSDKPSTSTKPSSDPVTDPATDTSSATSSGFTEIITDDPSTTATGIRTLPTVTLPVRPDDEEDPPALTKGALIGISIGASVVLCGIFVLLGYKRHS